MSSPDFETTDEPSGSREEMISASSSNGRAIFFASQGGFIQVSVSSIVNSRTGAAFSIGQHQQADADQHNDTVCPTCHLGKRPPSP